MDIRQLQYFVRIADEGSITGAARSLHMSQPPLSMQMKLLEEELGVTLFDRGSRTIRLTDAGKLLYNRAQGILELSGATVRELKDFGNGLAGTLRLGLISSAGTGEIGRRMRRFSKKYPEVRYEISEGNTYELLEMLRQGRIEVALARTPFPTEGLSCVYLEAEPMMAVGEASYFDGLPEREISIGQLTGKPLIIYRRWEPIILGAFHECGAEPEIFYKNDDARTTAIWADAGLGVGILPYTAALRGWSEGIVKKKLTDEKLNTRMAVVFRKDRYVSGIGRKFAEEF